MFAFAIATERSVEAIEPSPSQPTPVANFLANYCLDCHNAESEEGDREFDSFKLPLTSEQLVIAADEMIDQVTLNVMPPEDSEQPSDEERLAFVGELRDQIQQARDLFASTGGRTVMRRLSNREYEVTLATLFGRRVDTLGLTADFPKETTIHHVDTIGESLVTSGFLLDQYFQAASRLVEARLGSPATKPQSWHFTDNFRQYEELSGPHRKAFKYGFLCLYEQPNTDTRQGGYGHIENFLRGVPVSGLYDIEVLAQAMHRDTHYDPEIFRIDFTEPFQLAVVPGDVTKGHIHYPQAIEPVLGSTIVPDEKQEWLRFRVWLEAGQTPRFIFPNGPYESRASVLIVNERYEDELSQGNKGVDRTQILLEGALPHIKIDEIKINGPIEERGGSNEEKAVFGDDGFQPDLALEQLQEFARKAFRRPLDQTDRDRIEAIYTRRIAENAKPRQAALDTVKMILCSPSFLYLSEITPEDESELRPFDLASRLSYTLWAAPPDDVLFDSAETGRLTDTDELKLQIERLLDDTRSREFVVGFLDSWLNLRDIGNLPPPRDSVNEYYAENLPEAMKEETRLFFRNLLDENGSVTDFLDADYTYVDKKLAKLYGLPEQDTLRLADGFQRVSLAGNHQRGGVLGMASVLTVSANGVDTSPVTRGVWVLENVLGVTPPPPPDEVPSIDANVSGATTIREKLAIHSEDRACYVCHRNMDPLGFALETFDPIGRWRTEYARPKWEKNKPAALVDPSGKLPSGETFEDFDSFKFVLLEHRRDLFTRHLIEKLLTYSSGRLMERADQYEIDDILARVKADDYGLQTLVVEVMTSQIFRSR
ncbi:DUF1592 domain-containing protein [Rubripirellula amarantea]|nr:DUF1592 domain-containing protein [Rubripirellula amarantea]